MPREAVRSSPPHCTGIAGQYLHSSVRLLQLRIRQGDRRPVAPPEEAFRLLRLEPGGAAAGEEGEYPRYVVGSPATVHRQLGEMAASLGLDEVLVNTITHSHEARLRSYRLLAQAFPLKARQTVQEADAVLAG